MRGGRLIVVVLAGALLPGCGAGGSDDTVTAGAAGVAQSRPVAGSPPARPAGTSRAEPPAPEAREASAAASPAPVGAAPETTTAEDGGAPAGVAAPTGAAITPTAGASKRDRAAAPQLTARKQKALAPSARRPCSLVTSPEARAIMGTRILAPIEARQGPTCLYQASSGTPYVTLTVQDVSMTRLRKQLRNVRRVPIAGRTAICSSSGSPMLYLPVDRGRVLSVSGPCSTATRFAAMAHGRLGTHRMR